MKATIIREIEREWLADQLGASIANLGFPVGMGIAPPREMLLLAADKLFDRYARIIELSACGGNPSTGGPR